MQYTNLEVNEIFYSLQGEGGRAGEPSIFIRLKGCSAYKACAKSGVECDTLWQSGTEMSIQKIEDIISKYKGKWIVWTGGEPTDQLDSYHIEYFRKLGYKQAIECSGIRPPDGKFDYIALSPKVAEHIIIKKWEGVHINEVRYVVHENQSIPPRQIKADKYYISPHCDGPNLNEHNLNWCIDLCKQNPDWNLSIQQHKIWNVR